MENNGRTLIVILVVALIIALGSYIYYGYGEKDVPDVTESTESSLNESRDENQIQEEEWVVATSTGLTFRYPEDIGTDYLEMVDWPPEVRSSDEEFTCEEAGEETDRAGRTESVTVAGRDYCRTTIVEGAAGSVYTEYAYAFSEDDQTVYMTFSTRAPQCTNYDSTERSDCEDELDDFDPDEIADSMARTLILE